LNPNDAHDVPPFSLEGGGCRCEFSPDGKELAFTENPDPVPAISISAQIYTLDLTDPNAKPVKVSTSAGGNFDPAYSPDGRFIAWRSQERAGYESDKFRLMLYYRGTNPTVRDVLPDFDYWVEEFAWVPGGFVPEIYFTAGRHGEGYIYATRPLNGDLKLIADGGEYSDLHPFYYQAPPPPLGPRCVEGCGSVGLFATVMKVDHPAEVISTSESKSLGFGPCPARDRLHLPPDSGGFWSSEAAHYDDLLDCLPMGGHVPGSVTHLNDALLAQLDLPKMESFWFTAKDGTRLEGFLIRPPGFDATKKYSVKFLIHGGPQGAWGDDWSYRWNAELFAANGYVVVMINPRGSTGYGQAIVDGVNGDWGGKPFTDLMEGLDYAEQHYPFIDKNRECALGASYGGYMANWVL
jgi:dipeptidyl aminopeptidase/acylaminoacyl peptidase